jgi:hypothetical protein
VIRETRELALNAAKTRGIDSIADLDPTYSKSLDAMMSRQAPAVANAPPPGGESPRLTTSPGKKAILPVQPNVDPTYRSGYDKPPQWQDSEQTVGRSLEKHSPGWKTKEHIPHPKGTKNLMSTIPEYFKPGSRGADTIAVEVKNVAVADMGMNFKGWAEQLARRNTTLKLQYSQAPVKNWLFADLRGIPAEVNLPQLAQKIRTGVADAGRVKGQSGPTYDKVFFILDDKIVEMP